MSRLPIRWRLTLWFGAILALLLFSFSLVLIAVMRHQLLATVDAELSEELEEITNEIRIARTVPEMLEQTKRRFLSMASIIFRCWIRAVGFCLKAVRSRATPHCPHSSSQGPALPASRLGICRDSAGVAWSVQSPTDRLADT